MVTTDQNNIDMLGPKIYQLNAVSWAILNQFQIELLLQVLLHNPFLECWVTEKTSMFVEIQNSFAQI